MKKDLVDIGELLEREKMRLKAMENLGILNTEDAEDTARSDGYQKEFPPKGQRDKLVNWRGEILALDSKKKGHQNDTNLKIELDDLPGMKSSRIYHTKVGISEDLQTSQAKTMPSTARANEFT